MMELSTLPQSLAALARNVCTTLRFTASMRYVRGTPAADLPIGRCWRAPFVRAPIITDLLSTSRSASPATTDYSSNVRGLSRTHQHMLIAVRYLLRRRRSPNFSIRVLVNKSASRAESNTNTTIRRVGARLQQDPAE